MNWTIPIVIGAVIYLYIVVFNSTMKKYKESEYSLSWSQFVTDTFPVERLWKSFTG
jgi:hypothetical protein